MKNKIALIAALVISGTCMAQKFPVDPETNKITYTEVVEVPGGFPDAA